MNFLAVSLRAVLPIFLMMMAGYLSRRFHIVTDSDVTRLNSIAFRLFMPILLFSNIYNSSIESAIRPKLLIFGLLGVLTCFFMALALAQLFVRQRNQRGVVIQGLYRTNPVIIGIPIAGVLAAGADISALAVLIALIVPLFNVLAVICLTIYRDDTAESIHPLRLAWDIVKNPLIVSSAAGLLFLLAGLKLPSFAESAIKDLGGACTPVMLVALGASLRFDTMKKQLGGLAVVCVVRLLLMPALFLFLAWRMGFTGVEFIALMSVFASSTAMASYTMAQQMGGDAELAGNILFSTSILCPFTLFFWSMLFHMLGAF